MDGATLAMRAKSPASNFTPLPPCPPDSAEHLCSPTAPTRPVWSWIQMLGQEAARVPSTPGFEDLHILASAP